MSAQYADPAISGALVSSCWLKECAIKRIWAGTETCGAPQRSYELLLHPPERRPRGALWHLVIALCDMQFCLQRMNSIAGRVRARPEGIL